jgi:hypothetical protein
MQLLAFLKALGNRALPKKKPISLKFAHLVKQYKPRGYELEEKTMAAYYGLTLNVRKIIVMPITTRHALFIFLHEVGHVKHKHLHISNDHPNWWHEYEADQYAIKEMRKLGIAIPRRTLAERRAVLRKYCEAASKKHKTRCVDVRVLKYAYGASKWRKKYHDWSGL